MEQITFVDDFQLAIDTIEKNKLRLHDAYVEDFIILKRDVFTFLDRKSSVAYDLILVDPPYHDTSYERLLGLIEKNGFLAEHGVVVFESDKSRMIDVRMSSLIKLKEKVSGNTKFHIFTKGDLI